MASQATVMLVEDHPGTRRALAAAVQACGFAVVGAFGDGESAVAAAGRLRPQLALVDLGLPGIDGAETIRRLRAALPRIAVLVLSACCEPEPVLEAIEAGAGGYLLKDAPLPELRDALEQVLAGNAPLSSQIARHLLGRLQRTPEAPRGPQPELSARELEVLDLLARGAPYAQIAEALSIGLGTVQSHVKNVYRKLEVCSKAEAARVAIRRGLVAGD